MIRRILLSAQCVDVVSEAQRSRAVGLYPALASRVHVVDNGVELEAFGVRVGQAERSRLGFHPEDIVIGYVGTAPLSRGGRDVVDAVADIRCHRLKGIIVGDSGQAEQLRTYAREQGVADRVVVFGEAAFDDVPRLMAAMDVGLSIRRGREREQSELKVRQYLASGLCVVGTGGSNDFLRGRPFAFVIDSHERRAVASAVGELVAMGREGVSGLGARAREFAARTLSMRARNAERIALWEGALEQAGLLYVAKDRRGFNDCS